MMIMVIAPAELMNSDPEHSDKVKVTFTLSFIMTKTHEFESWNYFWLMDELHDNTQKHTLGLGLAGVDIRKMCTNKCNFESLC